VKIPVSNPILEHEALMKYLLTISIFLISFQLHAQPGLNVQNRINSKVQTRVQGKVVTSAASKAAATASKKASQDAASEATKKSAAKASVKSSAAIDNEVKPKDKKSSKRKNDDQE
jgi:hypothetical protein